MDLDEWELLPDEGFLQIHGDDGGGRKIRPKGNTVFHMNYFICPTEIESVPRKRPDDRLTPLSVHVLEPEPTVIREKPPDRESDVPTDPVSQVFFKKMKEAEFVDIKVESPRSGGGSREIVPQIDGAAVFQFEEKRDKEVIPCGVAEMAIDEEKSVDSKKGVGGGLDIWKWSLSGIGAICSLGVTVCCIIVVFSCKHPLKSQNSQSQTHANHKRMNRGVSHANRLSEVISAARGVPIANARITFGGHYDAAL